MTRISSLGQETIDTYFSSSLAGFWDERNNTLGEVPKELQAGVRRRARKRLKRSESYKRWVIEEWPTWVFEAAQL